MARPRTGTIHLRDGKLFARIDYTDSAGKRRSKEKRVRTKTEGRAVISNFIRELEDHGSESLNAIGTTFKDLADHLEKHYLIPPEYVNGRKVAGKRSYKDDLGILKILRESFGRMELRDITWGKIERFRSMRLKTPTIRGEQRSIARVDRELSLLRHALNIAIGERWLNANPFIGPRPLINAADEVKRKRVLELEEEVRLLAACDGPREHLRPIIICAIDTGMRRGEILKLKWSDLDWDGKKSDIADRRKAKVREFNTKTLRERDAALSKRLKEELQKLWDESDKNPDSLVFGVTNNVSNSFRSVCLLAEIENLRFHDLRRTFGTRLAKKNVPVHEIARRLGHTDIETTFTYLGLTKDSLETVANAIDEWNEEIVKMTANGKL